MNQQRFLDIIKERQVLHKRLATLDQEEEEILTRTVRIDEDQADFSVFRDATCCLLTQLWNAPDKMLSHEDIRQDVMYDESAPSWAIRQVIKWARRALQENMFPYAIENIKTKGYQLVIRTNVVCSLKNAGCISKTPKKT